MTNYNKLIAASIITEQSNLGQEALAVVLNNKGLTMRNGKAWTRSAINNFTLRAMDDVLDELDAYELYMETKGE